MEGNDIDCRHVEKKASLLPNKCAPPGLRKDSQVYIITYFPRCVLVLLLRVVTDNMPVIEVSVLLAQAVYV